MIVIYFVFFILLDVYSSDISSFILRIYRITDLSAFKYLAGFVAQNTFMGRFIILLPFVFLYFYFYARIARYR